MIKIENVSYQYPNNRKKVFSNLNLELQDGKIYGLLGMNGTGKSTLLYLISSLLKPQSGKITFNGKDVSCRTGEILEQIFIVPEEYDLPEISLDEYVKLNKRFYPKFNEEKLGKLLDHFKLSDKCPLNQLSMGQKKKIYICFALATEARLILMDEPTNGMDIPSKLQFRNILHECIAENTTILISTHQVKDVESLLDTVIMIDKNNILLNEDISTLKSRSMIPDSDRIDLESLFNNIIEKSYMEGSYNE